MKDKDVFLQCLIQLHPHPLLAAPRAAHKHPIHMKIRKVRKIVLPFLSPAEVNEESAAVAWCQKRFAHLLASLQSVLRSTTATATVLSSEPCLDTGGRRASFPRDWSRWVSCLCPCHLWCPQSWTGAHRAVTAISQSSHTAPLSCHAQVSPLGQVTHFLSPSCHPS